VLGAVVGNCPDACGDGACEEPNVEGPLPLVPEEPDDGKLGELDEYEDE
jgi:hypothetical protein